ncbi:hypothetical protein IQ254_11595 [Nodosilinea sp. LEGE 07088]|uniref:hypothetical protein n=1 Tax=Nodosilinea sp. LEGE 07088 TaxID=2777968 RepID=UPI00187ECD41|nr:hypothetical protein [Nodosilinea sp. LEGE 07088]MBE9137828.1 hypothetical protein [Nodosilinea sp. LEGE 07088]
MTPRLIASAAALRRPTSKPQRRSRFGLGILCVIASLGGHGVLLALVVPSPNPEPLPVEVLDESPAAPDDVSVTVLPKPAPEPAPTVTPQASVQASPPAPQAQSPEPVQQVESGPISAAPEPAPFTPPPAPPEPVEPQAPAPYANFPHLPGAEVGCNGANDCWRSPVSSSWRSAAGDLQAQLEAQGYRVDNVTGDVLSIDSGVRVYAVSKPGEANYYLNLVSVQDGVLYTMTVEPMTTEQVLALQQS